MKTIVTILLLSFTGLCGAQTISADDKLHFGAGALISATTYTVIYATTKNKKKAFWYSLGASFLAGVTKELIDESKYKGFDSMDLLATSLGGATVTFTFELIPKRKQKVFIY